MSAEQKTGSFGAGEEPLLPPGYESLSPYFAILDDDPGRRGVLAGLMLAQDYAPSEAELRDLPEFDVNLRYRRIGDAYAASIDPEYQSLGLFNRPSIISARDTFIGMIRPLSKERIRVGVTHILRAERRERIVDVLGQLDTPMPIDTTYLPPVGTVFPVVPAVRGRR